MTDEIEVYATDEHGRRITRTVITDPAATDHTLIATAELNQLRQRAEQAEAAIERVRRFSALVINGSIRVQAIHQARDTLTILDGEELKDPVIEAERDEAEHRIARLADQLVAELETRRGVEATINRVRALHPDDHGLCGGCTNAVGVPSPCATTRALNGETT